MYSSGYSSVTSFSTVASNASSTSTRRMIIPLYNLQAHNVLTNVIVDAGTDAKIAKFQKRGLEVIGLAMLEPVEVWAGASFDSSAPRPSEYTPTPSHLSQQYPSQSQSQHQPSSLGTEPPSHTPTSSALSLTSDSHYNNEPTPVNTTPTPQVEPRGGSARKFIGKIFRRKGGDNSAPSTPNQSQFPYIQSAGSVGGGGGATSIPTVNEPTPRSVKRSSLLANAASSLSQRIPSSPATSSFLPITPTRSQNVSESGGESSQANMVLGIQPILNSPTIPPRGKHPKMYVWVVRKWLKGSGNEGLFSSLSSSPGANVGPVEVRFEWARSKGGNKKKSSAKKDGQGTAGEGRRERRESMQIPSNTPSTTSLPGSGTGAQAKARDASKQRKSREASGVSGKSGSKEHISLPTKSKRRSISPNPPGSVNTHTTASTDDAPHSPSRPSKRIDDEDDGDDSDPEDSETPWTCTLTLRHSYSSRFSAHPSYPASPPPPLHSTSSTTSGSLPPTQQEIRVKVGAVVPTPHHPKVVALLKIPFPLPDIEVEKVAVHKRIVTPAGVARPLLSPISASDAGSPPNSPDPFSPGLMSPGMSRSPGVPPTSPGFSSFGKATSPFKSSSNGNPGSKISFGAFGISMGGSSSSNSNANSNSTAGYGGGLGLVLTAEEIKDVVCCTGLWLVVREGFGGVGKEKRKGDGWRIRG